MIHTLPAAVIPLHAPRTPVTVAVGIPETVNLADSFAIARFTCDNGLGTFDVQLYTADTPSTVANFLAYVDNHAYTGGSYGNTFIHRSIPGFMIQGGGYLVKSGPGDWLDASYLFYADRYAPVQNEPGISNVRGTLAMAKLADDPNSATNEWFFNLADNSGNLDYQNGGFTVFGDVLGSGMDVVDQVAAIPTYNASMITSAFSDLPIIGYLGAADPGHLASFSSISRIEGLSYAVAGTTPGTLSATVQSGATLVLQSSAAGVTTGTVQLTATSGTDTYTLNLPVLITGTCPTITTTSPLPTGTQGLAYHTILTATGGATPYTWAIADGSLPAGLALSGSGILSGTATATGAASFTVQVTGSNTLASTQPFSLTIVPDLTYAAWIASYPGVGSQTAFDDDPDGDGIRNGLENYLGTDPGQPSGGGQGLTQVAGTPLKFTFRHTRSHTAATDVTAGYEWSPDLAQWYAAGATGNGVTVTLAPTVIINRAPPQNDEIEVTATVTGGSTEKLFVRLNVTRNPP